MYRSLEPRESQRNPAPGWERDEGQTILSGDGAGGQSSYPLPRTSRIPSTPSDLAHGPCRLTWWGCRRGPRYRAVRAHRPVHAPGTAPTPRRVRGRDSPKWAPANGGGNFQLSDMA